MRKNCPFPKRYALYLTTDLTLLHKVLDWFDEFNQPPVPYKTWMECQLAVAEAFTNVVRIAHKELPPETPIDLEVSILSDCLEIRIWDYAFGLNLSEMLKMVHVNRDPDALGGRGLRSIELICDRISYTKTEDDRNCFWMVKHYSKS